MFGILILALSVGLSLMVIVQNPILLIGVIVMAAFCYFYIQKGDSEARAEQEELRQQNEEKEFLDWAVSFYDFCASHGLSELSPEEEESPNDLLVLASNMQDSDVSSYDVVDLFKKGKAESERRRDAERLAAEQAKRDAETAQYHQQSEWAELIGKDKYTVELKKQTAQLEGTIKVLNWTSQSMIGSAYAPAEKSDWAIAGGAASGIAGPAAGLAVASEIQAQNTANELSKQAELDSLNDRLRPVSASTVHFKEELETVEAELADIEDRLVDTFHTDGLFKHLTVSIGSLEKTMFGNLAVSMHVEADEDVTIFHRDAILDGSLKVSAYLKGDLIGCSYFNAAGVDSTELSLVGFNKGGQVNPILICPNEGKEFAVSSANDYEIKVEPYHLWLIESR